MVWTKKIAQKWRDTRKEKKKAYDQQWRKDNWKKLRGYEKKRLIKRREFIDDYKLSKGCAICGYSECAKALDFHHDGDKNFAISNATTTGIEKLKKEMEKCEILCCRCHRELHAEEEILRR